MRKKSTLTLEVYDRFLHNIDESYNNERFTIDVLNQVIFMHGFCKILRSRKNDLRDALSTITLIDPRRSTLDDDLPPPDASISLEQVKQDLVSLNWQECAVKSIETLGPFQSGGGGGDDVVSRHSLEGMSSFKISRKRPRTKRKRKKTKLVDSICRDDDDDDDGAAGHGNNGDDVACVDGGVVDDDQDQSLYVDTYDMEF
ncbi:hypothetical protein Tsubulata_042789 [Turnera subulata]|uniref:DUF7787 domain-containing protein n=1 Tax=Turnera subulata TaxID=218843 RepID=A0A9Q0FX75_9ROSI|nr:hypothetical protein Tsubulata_042789 [Turnera subulata]